jgi:hypothetical protein
VFSVPVGCWPASGCWLCDSAGEWDRDIEGAGEGEGEGVLDGEGGAVLSAREEAGDKGADLIPISDEPREWDVAPWFGADSGYVEAVGEGE